MGRRRGAVSPDKGKSFCILPVEKKYAKGGVKSMARMYKVSADVSEKEKAVGGIMTFGQAGWLDRKSVV